MFVTYFKAYKLSLDSSKIRYFVFILGYYKMKCDQEFKKIQFKLIYIKIHDAVKN